MKSIYLTVAAVSALAVTAPATAQSRNADRSTPQSWQGDRADTRELQARFDAGVRSGDITRREATPLRAQLLQLTRLERQYARAGFNAWERNALRDRSRTLTMGLNAAQRGGNGARSRPDRNDGFSDNDRRDGTDGKMAKEGVSDSDRRDMRGDRFSGDLRVGQRISARQVALPIEFRAHYRDSDTSYYRYDEDRIYQIDRVTGLIMAMFDPRG